MFIPEKLFVGLRGNNSEYTPLGFMCHDSGDKAFEKRKDTILNWAQTGHNVFNEETKRWEYVKDKTPNTLNLDNELLEGYQVSREVKRTSRWGGNVKWRIEDPRGFELEISSGNMMSILAHTTIVNGVIEGKCIWARDGKDNALVTENSEPYTKAVQTTLVKTHSISIKDVSVGDTIILNDESEVVYYGLFRCVCAPGYYYNQDKMELTGILNRHIYKSISGGYFSTATSMKVHSIKEKVKKPLTDKQAESYVNKRIGSGSIHINSNKFGQVLYVTREKIKPKDIKLYYREHSLKEFLAIPKSRMSFGILKDEDAINKVAAFNFSKDTWDHVNTQKERNQKSYEQQLERYNSSDQDQRRLFYNKPHLSTNLGVHLLAHLSFDVEHNWMSIDTYGGSYSRVHSEVSYEDMTDKAKYVTFHVDVHDKEFQI